VSFVELIFRGLGEIAKLLGRSFRSWSEWAADNPRAAARQLELIAGVLQARADAFKRQTGWRARRDRELAEKLRQQAHALHMSASDKHALRSVCSSKPGTYVRAVGAA
jgi:transcriptional regulator with XRE-family HTH domain